MKRSRSALFLGLVLVGLSACSQDPVPKVAPHESPVPSVNESADAPTAPALPALAKKRNAVGASAFVRYYIDVLNYAQRTGDVDSLGRLSDDNCSACVGYIEGIRKAYKGGGEIRGGILSIGPLRELPTDYGADWGAYAQGQSTPQVIVDGSGHRNAYPGGKFPVYAYSKWVAGAWQMHWIRTPL